MLIKCLSSCLEILLLPKSTNKLVLWSNKLETNQHTSCIVCTPSASNIWNKTWSELHCILLRQVIWNKLHCILLRQVIWNKLHCILLRQVIWNKLHCILLRQVIWNKLHCILLRQVIWNKLHYILLRHEQFENKLKITYTISFLDLGK
jgi:hypothetical protein